MLIERTKVGPYDMRLVERIAGPLRGYLAPRYYFLCRHELGPWLTAVAFLGHNKDHSLRQFERRRDNQRAALAAEGDCA